MPPYRARKTHTWSMVWAKTAGPRRPDKTAKNTTNDWASWIDLLCCNLFKPIFQEWKKTNRTPLAHMHENGWQAENKKRTHSTQGRKVWGQQLNGTKANNTLQEFKRRVFRGSELQESLKNSQQRRQFIWIASQDLFLLICFRCCACACQLETAWMYILCIRLTWAAPFDMYASSKATRAGTFPLGGGGFI